ncbi:hypothetical protein GCM10028819_07550 [Spirosoma humi]
MTVKISNKRVKIRSFSINTHPLAVVNPTSRQLGKVRQRSLTEPAFLAEESDDIALNPYSRAFFVLWLVASLVAIGGHYIPL